MRPVHALAVLPLVAVVVGPFFFNRVTPFVLGMPFLLAWLAFTLVMTSIVMAVIFRSDTRRAQTHRHVGGSGERA